MTTTFRHGAIVHQDRLISQTLYDVSNNLLTAQFDGRGNITRYSVVNKWEFIASFSSILQIGDRIIDYTVPKTVEMIGRRQIVTFSAYDTDIRIITFADSRTNAVFQQYEVTPRKEDVRFKNVINIELDGASYIKALFIDRFSLKTLGKALAGTVAKLIGKSVRSHSSSDKFVSRCDPLGECYIDVAMTQKGRQLERNRFYVNQHSCEIDAPMGKTSIMRLVHSMGTRGDFSECDVSVCFDQFNQHMQESENYIASFPAPNACSSDFLKSFYNSCYNCALSMYKEKGEFKGFMAGLVYQSPARTYFRDSYWTMLSVLPHKPELVKNEILTLARGIDKDGKCPSAVRYNFRNWWGNHYDSPSFFVLMLFDYIRATKDTGILRLPWRRKTILDAAMMVIEKLSECADSTGLLYKSGPYNRRDWCDNVFREGYVTYDEALYARALEALSILTKERGEAVSSSYAVRAEKVKNSINTILWDPNKGYYINYKNENIVEDNLSIDTVVTVLFGIADKERARSVLEKMEKILESKNNAEQKAGDFGVLSVYPFYKFPEAVVAKSSYPYYYHNGGDWPYWSAIYAYAKKTFGMEYLYPLTRWFEYNAEKKNFTPVEFFSPFHKDGSLLQGWSGAGAFALEADIGFFSLTSDSFCKPAESAS
jgi:hypothetical protein